MRRGRHGTDGRRVIVEINPEHLAGFGALFAGLVAKLDALYDTYTDEQLTVILDFLRRSAQVQQEATTELAGSVHAGLTATWCAMGVCGNRQKVSRHRERRRSQIDEHRTDQA